MKTFVRVIALLIAVCVGVAMAQPTGGAVASPQLPQFAIGTPMKLIPKNGAKPLIGFSCFAPVSSSSCTALWPSIEGNDWRAWNWVVRICNEATVSDRPRGRSCSIAVDTNSVGFVGGVMLVIPTHDGERTLNALWPAMARDLGTGESEIRNKIERFAVSGVWQ